MNEQEFKSMALQELQAVYRLAWHLAPDGVEADEMVQETYLCAFRAWRTFTPGADGMRPWLFKILHNVFRRRLSRRRREPELLKDADHLPARSRDPGSPHGTRWDDERIDWERVDERLKRAIHALPLAQRTVFLMFAVERLKYKEIADVLDVSIGTVMSRLFRAREVLAAELAPLGIGPYVRSGSAPAATGTARRGSFDPPSE